jgi:hypothetical protein
MKKLIVIVWCILFLIVIIYLLKPLFQQNTKVNSDSQQTTTKQQSNNTKSTSDNKPTINNQIYSIGDTVGIGDADVTILDAELGNPDPYAISKNGKVLILQLSGKNNGSSSWWFLYNDFELYDENRNKLDFYVGGNNYMPISGELHRGKKISGQIKFDVKPSAYYHLYYKPNFLKDKEVHWMIKAAN